MTIVYFIKCKGPIFPPHGDAMQNIGKELTDCALMMCEATGEFASNNIPAVIIGDLTKIRKCIMDMIKLMIDGRDIMSSSLTPTDKNKKLKAWLKQVKKQKSVVKKKVNALWNVLTRKQKKNIKMALNKLKIEKNRLCKKIKALINNLSALLKSSSG